MNKRKLNITKILILLIIIWNVFITYKLFNPTIKPQTDNTNIVQTDNIKSAILDFEVAEIPEIDITKE